MKPPPFAYHVPCSVGEAVALLGELGGEARVIAGGQSLVPLLNFRLARPAHLVDINRIDELDYVRAEDGVVAIGACARQAAVERSPVVREACPLLAEAVEQVAHPPVRHRGTVCGSLAHADPAAEIPAALLALGGELVLWSVRGERRVPAGRFFRGPFATAVESGELLAEVRVGVPPAGSGCAFVEYSHRHGDFAVAGAAAVIRLGQGRIADAAIALCGVSDVPVRARPAEEALRGCTGGRDELDAAARLAVADLEVHTDLHGDAGYRRGVARSCVRRALERALARARGEAA